VTQVLLEEEHLRAGTALPVGRARPGTRIEIRDAEGELLPAGSPGEIYLVGDTVARGYFGQPQLSARVFRDVATPEGGEAKGQRPSGLVRSYRSGDLGYLDETGMLHYQGRLDSQIKLNGYRMELGDIVANLRALTYVSNATVLPTREGARIRYLTAYVTLNGSTEETGLAMRMRLRHDLSQHLPAYMVPKRIVLLDELPLTVNGKIDCAALLLKDSQRETA
jgi:D-alanine--poly(phosphoribitol) ligase subunit 1